MCVCVCVCVWLGLLWKDLRPLQGVKEHGAAATVVPEPRQKALHPPGVGTSVIHLHLHPIVPFHALPVASGDEELPSYHHQSPILMEGVKKLDLRGNPNSELRPK